MPRNYDSIISDSTVLFMFQFLIFDLLSMNSLSTRVVTHVQIPKILLEIIEKKKKETGKICYQIVISVIDPDVVCRVEVYR